MEWLGSDIFKNLALLKLFPIAVAIELWGAEKRDQPVKVREGADERQGVRPFIAGVLRGLCPPELLSSCPRRERDSRVPRLQERRGGGWCCSMLLRNHLPLQSMGKETEGAGLLLRGKGRYICPLFANCREKIKKRTFENTDLLELHELELLKDAINGRRKKAIQRETTATQGEFTKQGTQFCKKMEEQNCLLLDRESPEKQQYKKHDIKIACYILLPWLLVLSFLVAVLFELYQKPIGIDDPTKDLPQKTLLSHKIREVQVDRLLTSDIDTSRDIVGQIRFGYGSRDQPCLTIFFEHTSEITVHAKVGPKAKFTQSQGNYTHNNQTGVWECHPTESMWWSITIKGEEHAQWTGDVTNEMLTSGKMGRSKTEIWYKTQSYGKILDPSLLSISAGDDDWTRVWNFQVERETALVKVSFVFTVTNSIAPEVRVNPRSVQEELEPIELQSGKGMRNAHRQPPLLPALSPVSSPPVSPSHPMPPGPDYSKQVEPMQLVFTCLSVEETD
ncbi:uncharacterized protein LOC128468227 [Spea bombifrons]|uniref:uncharacterized protein LOC128468227 n=1 Tax=Spea bombifrons TaxID=233779 RepID=UPI00234B6BFD|nr:uncharacterized protein LOC128468227 [Spea bombifrons]